MSGNSNAQRSANKKVYEKEIQGTVWQVVGVMLVFIGAVVQFANQSSTSGFLSGWGVGFLSWMCILNGIALFNHGRKYTSPGARRVFAQDKRKPVVYLRSFGDDAIMSQGYNVYQWKTEDEQIADVMKGIGPFIAIGNPREKLPELGAARTYVGDHEWQRTISILSSHAQLVVLRAGDTPGLWWEVERVSKSIKPERILFLIPYGKQEYDAFREKANVHFPKPLPAYLPAKGMLGLGTLRGIVYFEKDWTSHYVPLRNGMWAGHLEQTPLSRMLSFAIQPVLKQLKIPVTQAGTPLVKRIGRLLLFAVLVLAGFCLAILLISMSNS